MDLSVTYVYVLAGYIQTIITFKLLNNSLKNEKNQTGLKWIANGPLKTIIRPKTKDFENLLDWQEMVSFGSFKKGPFIIYS